MRGDIREECSSSDLASERPRLGDWLAIWGANSSTGQFALQLAKLARMKIACVADLTKGGKRLSELGADFMVDKYDTARPVEILRAATGEKLRFSSDCAGKESAGHLQQALQNMAAN